MKNTLYIIAIVLVCFTSCEKDFEPTSKTDINNIITSSEGLEYLKNGAYSLAREVYGKYFLHFAEMLADTGEIYFIGSFQEFSALQDKFLDNTFYYGDRAWKVSYSAINDANLIIDNIAVIPDEDEKAVLEGQAKFIRGLLYFDLLRFYGLPYGPGALSDSGIVLTLKGTVSADDINNSGLASNQKVIDVVKSDLIFAYNNLYEDEVFFASKYSAAAILSRVYLTLEEYDSAAFYANEVIESGLYELTPDFFRAFNHSENKEEDVFAWQQTAGDNVGSQNDGMATFYASTNEVGRGDITISEDFIYSTYDTVDTRGMIQYGIETVNKLKDIFYEGFSPFAPGYTYCAKWLDYKTNITMVRLAEMYLTRAEANQMLIDNGVNLNPVPMPVEDIKVIRSRAGIDVSALTTVNIDDIKLERYKELIFEGHRLHDYKRWKQSVWIPETDTSRYIIDYDSYELIIPIPKSELDANPNI